MDNLPRDRHPHAPTGPPIFPTQGTVSHSQPCTALLGTCRLSALVCSVSEVAQPHDEPSLGYDVMDILPGLLFKMTLPIYLQFYCIRLCASQACTSTSFASRVSCSKWHNLLKLNLQSPPICEAAHEAVLCDFAGLSHVR